MVAGSKIFTLTSIEAAYVVATLRIALDENDSRLEDRDREIMTAVMLRLAAPMDLSEAVKTRIDKGESHEQVENEN